MKRALSVFTCSLLALWLAGCTVTHGQLADLPPAASSNKAVEAVGEAGESVTSPSYAGAITLGSTAEEVTEALGPPDLRSLHDSRGEENWRYGANWVTLHYGRVTAWKNNDGRLPLQRGASG